MVHTDILFKIQFPIKSNIVLKLTYAFQGTGVAENP